MAALQDEWYAARVKRQQAIAQRQEDVQSELSAYQQVRAQNAVTTRKTLTENYAAVQAETDLYLTQVQQQRAAQAKLTAAELREFDMELKKAVAAKRQDYQAYLAELQQTTQASLTQHQQDRMIMAQQQQKKLVEYIAELEAFVADYLTTVTANREAESKVAQAKRRSDREALSRDVQVKLADLAAHKPERQAFCEGLRQSIWGTSAPRRAALPPNRPKSAAAIRQPDTRRPRAKAKPAAAAKMSQPSAVKQVAVPTSTSSQPAVSTEEAVFDYLQSHPQGTRLTEIESTLGINRFQAVDALRSLIQKELIVQKDRIYRIREEAVL
ncbi:MAG: hypothetical protein ACFB12_22105 [Leptolyngbyaceae cyanobacterium]